MQLSPHHQFHNRTQSYVTAAAAMAFLLYAPCRILRSSSIKVVPHLFVSRLSTSLRFKMPKDPTGDPKAHPTSNFANGITGSCLCGSISVTIKDDELFTKRRGHLCHCANCRKVAGSYVAANLLIETEKVDIKDRDGTKKVYEDRETLSGNPVYRSFCSKDGKYVEDSPIS